MARIEPTTRERVEALGEAKIASLPLSLIAERLGTRPDKVASALRTLGWKSLPKPDHAATLYEVGEERVAGMPLSEVAGILDVSVEAARGVLRRLGWAWKKGDPKAWNRCPRHQRNRP